MEWILTSERKPPKHTDVIVTVKLEDDNENHYFVTMGQRTSNGWDISEYNDAYCIYDGDKDCKVTAWKHKPNACEKE